MTPCIEQYTNIGNDGYARLYSQLRGNSVMAAKKLWEDIHGRIEDSYEPDHLCKNRLCINLDHIEIVTHLENQRRKGKLTIEQVKEIRYNRLGSQTKASIAREFGVSFMTITFIERRKTWKEV